MNDNEANETVEHVCEIVKRLANGSYRCAEDADLHPMVRRMHEKAANTAVEFADRMLAAHKREIAAKDDARLTVVANYEAVIAAKERIVAAKDAEIASLRALVKELADALEEAHDTLQDLDFCTLCTLDETCPKGVDEDEDNPFECPRLNQIWSLVAKAREACNA